jgi:hypothetical protein
VFGAHTARARIPRPCTLFDSCLFVAEFDVYALLSKPSVRISVASGKAYKAVSYLIAEYVAEVGYLRVIVLSFSVGVGNLLLRAKVEGYEGIVFSLAYRVQFLYYFLLTVAFSIEEFASLEKLTRVWRVLSKLHLVERCNVRLCCSFKAHEDVAQLSLEASNRRGIFFNLAFRL